jgi:hypothetical protein
MVLGPGEDFFLWIGNEAKMKNGAKKKIVCFGEEVTETKITLRGNCPGFKFR